MRNKTLLYLGLGISILIVFTSVLYIYPIPGSDAITFIPAALKYARGEGLVNPIYDLACQTDPAGLCRYCFHLPLYPWLTGTIGKLLPTTGGMFLISGLYTLLLLLVVFNTFLKLGYQNSKKSLFILGGIILLSVTFYKLPTVGRPELLSSLLSVILYTQFNENEKTGKLILRGIVLGLLGVTHAVGFIFAASFIFYYYLSNASLTYIEGLKKAILITVTGVVIFLILMWVSPNGLKDTLTGIADHWMHVQLNRADTSVTGLLKYWFFNPEGFMFGLIFGIAVLFWVGDTRKKFTSANGLQKIVILSFSLFVVVCLFVFALKSAPTVYNISQFYPVICIYLFSKYAKFNEVPPKYLLKTSLLIVAFGVTLIYPLRNMYLFGDMIQKGKTYWNAKKQYDVIVKDNPEITLSWQMWCLTDDYSKVSIWKEDNAENGDLVLYQQARGELPNSLITEYQLKLDWRCPNPDKVLGIPISNRPQGYSFSVWEKNKQVSE